MIAITSTAGSSTSTAYRWFLMASMHSYSTLLSSKNSFASASLLISSIARKPSAFTVLPFGNLRTQSSSGSSARFASSTGRSDASSARRHISIA